eukprot:maker-scaffold922_size80897-snap-gene-0.17 protein:Tk09251 transcript:maker-scaffold922_size80897-snap-gene-0.17-mRNA-1 annotation:"hypothetical protein D910_02335"
MYRTFSTGPENAPNALDTHPDETHVVVAGRNVFKVFTLDEGGFNELYNLRSGRSINLNYSCNDVAWSPYDDQVLCTAATNGAVVLWNLAKTAKSKPEHIFADHKRTVNQVCFHPSEAHWLLSASQDGTIRLFDMRSRECTQVFCHGSESIRDAQFSPHQSQTFASAAENGRVSIWDMRKPDRAEKSWNAHTEYVFSCDWHPNCRAFLATAGRDKTVKVWNIEDDRPKLDTVIQTIGPVGRVKWRPNHRFHIACSALALDFSVHIWDVRRPWIPLHSFDQHTDVTTDFVFRRDSEALLSTGRDGMVYHHALQDGIQPMENSNPHALALNLRGDISYISKDKDSMTDAMTTIKAESIIPLPPPMPPVSLTSPAGASSPMGNSTPSASASAAQRNSITSRVASADKIKKTVKDKEIEEKRETIRGTKSIMKIFGTFDSGPELPLDQSETAEAISFLNVPPPQEDVLTNNDAFITCAKSYKFTGDSFAEMCDHNEAVAHNCHLFQVSTAWSIIKILNGGFDYDPAIASAEAYRRNLSSGVDDPLGPNAGEADNWVRSASNRLRHLSGVGGLGDKKGDSGGGGRITTPLEGESENDSDESQDEMEAEDMLANIASGQMLGDYRVNPNEDQDLFLEEFVYADMASAAEGSIGWKLRTEAFDPRHELNQDIPHDEAADEQYVLNGMQNDENRGNNEDDPIVPLVDNLTIEDQTGHLLSVPPLEDLPEMDNDPVIQETLEEYAKLGDIQTVVVMYLVLGDKMKGMFDDDLVEYWFTAYIDMLKRHKLYNEANMVIKACPVKGVNSLNLDSTVYYSNCTECSRALNQKGAWFCERCRSTPFLCAVCQDTVRGVFAWCQGCGHGGHANHLRIWYNENKLCPTGCGHACQYQ